MTPGEEITAIEVVPSWVRVARLTYDAVDLRLDGGRSNASMAWRNAPEHVVRPVALLLLRCLRKSNSSYRMAR